MGIAEELRSARARVSRLERLAQAATCAQLGEHDWQLLGGRNAGCNDDCRECSCSVPVYQCARCGDCDYGENTEAEKIMADCAVNL